MGQGKFQTKSQTEERGKSGEGLRSFPGSGQTEDEVKISAALENVGGKLNPSAGQEKPYSISAVALAYVLAKAPRVFPSSVGARSSILWTTSGRWRSG